MQIKFIPLDFDYVDIEGKSMVRMFGRTKEGKSCCVIDSCQPYFWLFIKKKANLKKCAEKVKKIKMWHAGRHAKVTEIKIKDKKYMGEDVKALQVFVNNPKDLIVIKDQVKTFKEIDGIKEIDLNFVTRYILEKDIKPLQLHEVEGQELTKAKLLAKDIVLNVDLVIKASHIQYLEDSEYKPRILAFDIETTGLEIEKGEILMISFVSENMKKVITSKHFSNPPEEIEFVKNENELIKRFKEIIKKEKPDILTGYNSDGFDIPYLRARADENNIKLDLGLDESKITFIRGRVSSSKITGIVHIDLFKFVDNIISYILQSETVSLNAVAKELVGEEKIKLDLGKIAKELKKESKLKDIEMRKFALYNLQDSILTYKLALQLWPTISEMTKIISEPLFNVSRASYSQLVEGYILHNLKRFNEIAPNRPTYDKINERRQRKKYIGASVFQPEAGLYENVAVFDFRSFWPSIIVSFNISLPTLTKKHPTTYKTPEFEYEKKKQKFYFEKKQGFIPQLLKELLERRRDVKHELKRNPSAILAAKDYSLKTLSNATYGYFGFFGARYYSPESAASITAIGRYYIQKIIDSIEKAGLRVIYSDTDSIMFTIGKKTEKQTLALLDKLNKDLPGTMDLELEDFYKRGIFVTKRTGEVGAKKKYSLLNKKGDLKIRGFETVRRDWCNLTRKMQDKILSQVLKEGKAESSLKYVQDIIKKLRKKQIENQELVIKTQLRKPIEEYVAIGPHVAVAKIMEKQGIPVKIGSIIEYIVVETKNKKDRIRDKARLLEEVKQGNYDAEYYINHQIIPAVESIFNVFKIEKEEISEKKKQKKLGDF